MTNITPDAAARREAARDRGKFGAQDHTGPEVELDLHETELEVGRTRVMPLMTDRHSWYDEDLLEAAMVAGARADVSGIVTRVGLPEGTPDPAARYLCSLRSANTGESGYMFTYETGDQDFERTTPTVTEVIVDAAAAAAQESGRLTDDPDGSMSVMAKLTAVLGEKGARDMLAHAHLRYGGMSQPEPTDPPTDTYAVSHPAYKSSTGMTLDAAKALRLTLAGYLARYESVTVTNERTGDLVP